MAKLRMLAVFAAGYVAGSAAGRQRYEDIKSGVQRVAGSPRVQTAAGRAKDTVVANAPAVADAVKTRTAAAASAVADKVTSHDQEGDDEPAGQPAPADGGAPLS